MKRLEKILRSNIDILFFQISNFAFSPLLYFLLGSGRLENGLDLLKTIYLIEVYLAVPAVIFYFNQRKISALVDIFGKPLYDAIAVVKILLSVATGLVMVFVSKAIELQLLSVFILCLVGNAITPHWLLSQYSYTRFTLAAFIFRLGVLAATFFGFEQLLLPLYTVSLLAPGLFAYAYFRNKISKGSGAPVWPVVASIGASGSISLVRTFATSTLLFSIIGLVSPNTLSIYATLERVIRSGFSFMVPYILRLNLRRGIHMKTQLLPILLLVAGALTIYFFHAHSYLLLLLLAVMILSLDLIAFIFSEQVGSNLASRSYYIVIIGLFVVSFFGFYSFLVLLALLALLPFLVRSSEHMA
ncbi:hypothetical protein [Meiothermus sp.]|uniref:hypothetical protein n=1 Tax=Meiothermus sp. TaxID=1955249 RepID=UPI00307E612C